MSPYRIRYFSQPLFFPFTPHMGNVRFRRLGLPMNSAIRFLLFGFLSAYCLASGQTPGQLDHPIARVCDILKTPASFDGREVTATGVAGNSFHQVDFWDPECALPKHGGAMLLRFANGYGLGQPGDKKYLHLLRREGAVALTVKGKFVSTGGPFGPEGAPYEFLISEVIKARKLSKEYRQRLDIGSGKTNSGGNL